MTNTIVSSIAALRLNRPLSAMVCHFQGDLYVLLRHLTPNHGDDHTDPGRAVAHAWAHLSDITGQLVLCSDRCGTAAMIREGEEARRATWAWAAEDAADILHTGPRTLVAHTVTGAVGHLLRAAKYLRED